MKRHRSIGYLLVVILWCAATTLVRAEQTGSVRLRVDTAGLPAEAGAPVSGGVPFPMGAVATVDHLRLETLQGSVIPANYWKLVNWSDGSVKAALLSFVPVPSGDSFPDVVLQYGPSVSHAASGPVQVVEDASTLTITTDVLKLQLSKSRFTVLEQAWTDLNGDRTFASGEQWLTGPGDLVVTDKKTGRVFRSSLWTAGDGFTARLVEAGPQKAVVLLDGRLKGVGGAVTSDGDPTIVQAKAWLTVQAGSTLVRLQTTIIDTKARNAESFSTAVLDLDGVALEVPTVLASASYAAGGEAGALYQGSVGSGAFLLQDANVSFNGSYAYDFFYSGVGSGLRAPGWMDVAAGGRGITMGLNHFWQNFPAKLAAGGTGVLRLEFVPTESQATFWAAYPGIGKTYEGFLDLHAGGYTAAIRRRAELWLEPTLLLTDPTWYASSQAFGPLSPSSDLAGHWDVKMENQYTCTALRSGCSIYAQIYGQRDFGDYQQGMGTNSDGSKYAEFGDLHYEDPHGWLLQFVRTGNRKWFDYAAPMARHHYDIDVMHAENPARYAGFPPGKIHWHGRTHEGATIELGHVVPGGLDEYFLLTGDPRALDVLYEQGNWLEQWARWGNGRVAPERSGDSAGLTEYERPTAWTLYSLMKSYEATGDPKFWDGASVFVKNTIDWWKWPQDHIVFDPNRQLDLTKPPQDQALYYQRSDWTQGTGYPLPTLRVDNCAQTSAPISNYAYQTHAPIAWMSGLLQTALIRYYLELERRGGSYSATVSYRGQATSISVDTATMREMFIQMLNTIVDHNFVGATKYPSKYPWLKDISLYHFVYSVCPERDPWSTDGGQYLQWTLVFISSFSQSQVSSRWQATWPQLQAKWRDIAMILYKKHVVDDLGWDTGYNGAPNMWNMPYAIAKMESLGLLSSLPTAPPPTTTSTTSTTSSSSSPPPPSTSSSPAYQVTINDGNPFLTSQMVDLRFVAPSSAAQVNVSITGYGQGTWQAVAEVHGFELPPGAGTKTLYVQFKDAQGALLAALKKTVVLVQSGFSGDVTLELDEARDTFVFSNNSSTNYGAWEVVSAGAYDTGYDYWGLFQCPIPAIPSGVQLTVKDARLQVYLVDNTRNTSQVITPYDPTQSWNEDSVTWANRPLLGLTTLGSGVTFTGKNEVNQWKTFSLKPDLIQEWVNTPASARGIALVGDGSTGKTNVDLRSSEFFVGTEDRRPRLTLQLALSAVDQAAPVISGVQAVSIGETSAIVQWTTDEPADGLAEYGTTTSYGQAGPRQTSLSTSHAVTLSNLTARTTYHARATSKDAAGNVAVSGDVLFTTTGAILGDVNRDGQVTVADVPPLLSQLLGLSPVTQEISDVNRDGRMSVSDVQALVNLL